MYRATRHSIERGILRSLHDDHTASRAHREESRRAIVPGAGKENGNHMPVVIDGGRNRTSTDGRVWCSSAARVASAQGRDVQMVVRRCDVDASIAQRLEPDGIRDPQGGRALEDLGCAARSVTSRVQRDEHRRLERRRQGFQDRAEHTERTCRTT